MQHATRNEPEEPTTVPSAALKNKNRRKCNKARTRKTKTTDKATDAPRKPAPRLEEPLQNLRQGPGRFAELQSYATGVLPTQTLCRHTCGRLCAPFRATMCRAAPYLLLERFCLVSSSEVCPFGRFAGRASSLTVFAIYSLFINVFVVL